MGQPACKDCGGLGSVEGKDCPTCKPGTEKSETKETAPASPNAGL